MEDKKKEKTDEIIPINPNSISITSPAGFAVSISTEELNINKSIGMALDVFEFLIDKTEDKEVKRPEYIN